MTTLFIDLKKTREQLDSVSFDKNAPAIFSETHEMALSLLDAFLRFAEREGRRTLCSAEAIEKRLKINNCDWRHRAQELVLRKMNGSDPRCCEKISEMECLMIRAVAFICAMAVADTPWPND